jgi:hypothetical protein
MTQRIQMAGDTEVVVQDGVQLSQDESEDLWLLANDLGPVLPSLMDGRVLGFVIGKVKVAFRFGKDKEAGE